MDDPIGWCERRLREICVEKIHIVGYAYHLRELTNYREATLVHKGRSNVETVSSLPIPRISRGHGVRDNQFATQWTQWRCRKIKWSIEIFSCGDAWFENGLPQEIEPKLRSDQELVPHI